MIRLASTLVLLLAVTTSPVLAASMHSVTMKALTTDGEDQEVVRLLDEKHLTIVQVILRNEKAMDEHSVEEPSTIHCVSGSGVLIDEDGRHIPLQTGIVVVLPPGQKHVIEQRPDGLTTAVLPLRFRFTGEKISPGSDTEQLKYKIVEIVLRPPATAAVVWRLRRRLVLAIASSIALVALLRAVAMLPRIPRCSRLASLRIWRVSAAVPPSETMRR